MDFDFTAEQEAFRKEVRAWLETNLPDDLRGKAFASSRLPEKMRHPPAGPADGC